MPELNFRIMVITPNFTGTSGLRACPVGAGLSSPLDYVVGERDCVSPAAPQEGSLSEEIHIQFTRFSAFYSPLIATIAGGFLKAEGLQPKHSNAPVGKSAIDGVVAGTVHVCQSAPSQGFGPLEKGQTPP